VRSLRTIRLDPSDRFVFPVAAEPGEWAVTGTFLFWGRPIDQLEGKERAAFRSGFVGVDSLGFSTLVVVEEIREDEHRAAVEALAHHIHSHLGAPTLDAATAAAAEELAFAASLADHDIGTLVAMHRLFEQGEIHEQYRTLKPRERTPGADGLHAQARAFTFHEMVDDEAPEERVDLIGMMGPKP
jgi:hypothetical protein